MKLGFELKWPGSREHGFDGYILQYLKYSERVDTECSHSKQVEGWNDDKK